MPEWDSPATAAQRRVDALDLAVEAHKAEKESVSFVDDRAGRILATARRFEAYLRGEQRSSPEAGER